MRETNIAFQEEYKKVDKFIREAYKTTDGISEYIDHMKGFDREGQDFVESWKSDLNKLKSLRWKRNQLAHEVSIDEELCTLDDVFWIRLFHQRLMKGTDPLTVFMRQKEAAEKRAEEDRAAAKRFEAERRRIAAQNSVETQRQSTVQRQNESPVVRVSQSGNVGRNETYKAPVVPVRSKAEQESDQEERKSRRAIRGVIWFLGIVIAILLVVILIIK